MNIKQHVSGSYAHSVSSILEAASYFDHANVKQLVMSTNVNTFQIICHIFDAVKFWFAFVSCVNQALEDNLFLKKFLNIEWLDYAKNQVIFSKGNKKHEGFFMIFSEL